MASPRLLFITTHPKEVASTRYRVLSYEPFLRRAGFAFRLHSFFSSQALQSIYGPWGWNRKARWFLQGVRERLNRLRILDYDLIFVHRELFPWGMTLGMSVLLKELRRTPARLIYDFDDAIYLPHRRHRFLIGRLENPESVHHLMSISHCVIAGNRHLADYSSRFNPRVEQIPTPVDTDRFFPKVGGNGPRPCTIGWIGSPSTAKYLADLMPVFQKLALQHSFRLKIIGANRPFRLQRIPVENRPWSLEGEMEEFRSCDIGVYPLWDDEWARGKCGFKALQFMASGVPVVASRVGMNEEIIQERVNGLLAASPQEWESRLGELLEDPDLRERLGGEGRQTVERHYALSRVAPRLIQVVEETLGGKPQRPLGTVYSTPRRIPAAERQNILCFSSIDWDFIWQGHQEIMSHLARQGHRVLFIENTGVRNPRFKDLPRIRHRLEVWRRSLQGFRKEAENLYVYSPLILPFPYSRLALRINRRILLSTLRRWMDGMDFYQPVCWTFLPTPMTLQVLERIPRKALVYYCIDSFPDSTPAAQRIVQSEEALFQIADLVFVTSRKLCERADRLNRQVHLFPFGVNFQAFDRVRQSSEEPPEELRRIPRPRVGYIGGVHQWVDQDLLCSLAQRRPDLSFVLVGPLQTEVEKIRQERNIFLLGQRPHNELTRYLKGFDAAIIPYRLTEYTNNVYPTKLNEYHAMAKPVVSTPLPEIIEFNRTHPHLVEIGSDPEDFSGAIDRVLRQDSEDLKKRRVAAARENSWDHRIETMQGLIAESITRRASLHREGWPDRFLASQRISRALTRWTAGLTLSYLLVFHTPLVWWMARPLTLEDPPRSADAIVVFAGGVGESGQGDEGYRERVKQAAELYHQGYAPRILYLSGYMRTFDEVMVMRSLTESLGVPSDRILTERQVRSTVDYVRRAGELARRQDWKGILLVTSRYHGRRADLTFRKNVPALTVIHVPVRTAYYQHTWGITLKQLQGILHEALRILYYRFRGWA